jgi:DNA-directed RNA polymerase alpha subunit
MEVHGGPDKRKRRKKADPEWIRFMSEDEKEKERQDKRKSASLAEVGLPVRIANALESQSIFTLGDLSQMTLEQLETIPNLGTAMIRNCIRLLEQQGIPHKLHEPPGS